MEIDFNLILSVVRDFLIVLFSLSVHESAHAYTAHLCGDDTARLLGRITLNPIPHTDPIGTVLLPISAAFMHWPVIGWAKPVPVNPLNMRHPLRDNAIVSAAGPISNIFISMIGLIILSTISLFSALKGGFFSEVTDTFERLIYINILLASFNFIPIPPLDGAWILSAIFPRSVGSFYDRIRPFSFFILLILFYTNIFNYLFLPISLIISLVFLGPIYFIFSLIGG